MRLEAPWKSCQTLVTSFGFIFQVLALKGSYHGDTLGAMETQAPSSYSGFLQQPWYKTHILKKNSISLSPLLELVFLQILSSIYMIFHNSN